MSCGITITCDSPPDGSVGTAYTHAFPASGAPNLFFSIISGSLPPGLTLDPATGIVSGTPTADGDYPFTIEARAALIAATGDDGSFSDSEIVLTSTDAATWTQQTTDITDSGWSIIYSAALGLWINGTDIAGTTEQLQTSPDALSGNWTRHSTPADGSGWVKKMVSGATSIVALYQKAGAMHVMYSTNGTTWTLATLPVGVQIAGSADVAYSPDLDRFCIAEVVDGTPLFGVLTSDDGGVTWVFHEAPENLPALAIAWGAGLFVVVGGPQGSGDHLMTSPDGFTWTVRADPGGSPQNWDAIHYGNGIFVIVSSDISTNPGNQAATSTTGLTWTIRATPGTNMTWSCVTYGYGTWVAGAENDPSSQPLMTSTDNGVTWALIPALASDFGFVEGIAFGPSGDCFDDVACSITIGGGFGNVFDGPASNQCPGNMII